MPLDEANDIHTTWQAAKTAAQVSLRNIQQRQQELWEDRETGEWEDLLGMQKALTPIFYCRDPWADWLRPSQLVHGGAYKIRSRNLSHGIWNEKTQGFVGIREKFGDLFLFTEYHHDTGGTVGTATPLAFIETCPITDLREYHSRCTNGRSTYFGAENEDGTGWRYHTDDDSRLLKDKDAPGYCTTFAHTNKPLFEWLTELEERETAKEALGTS